MEPISGSRQETNLHQFSWSWCFCLMQSRSRTFGGVWWYGLADASRQKFITMHQNIITLCNRAAGEMQRDWRFNCFVPLLLFPSHWSELILSLWNRDLTESGRKPEAQQTQRKWLRDRVENNESVFSMLAWENWQFYKLWCSDLLCAPISALETSTGKPFFWSFHLCSS